MKAVSGAVLAASNWSSIGPAISRSDVSDPVSQQSREGGSASLARVRTQLRNNQVGVTTVGEIQSAGGNVVPTLGGGFHVTVTNINGTTASPLFKAVANPNPKQ